MSQVEQWCSPGAPGQRKRLGIADFSDKTALASRLMTFVEEWNAYAHPFNGSTRSSARIMGECDLALAAWLSHPFNGALYLRVST
jgi:hypothetical protein